MAWSEHIHIHIHDEETKRLLNEILAELKKTGSQQLEKQMDSWLVELDKMIKPLEEISKQV